MYYTNGPDLDVDDDASVVSDDGEYPDTVREGLDGGAVIAPEQEVGTSAPGASKKKKKGSKGKEKSEAVVSSEAGVASVGEGGGDAFTNQDKHHHGGCMVKPHAICLRQGNKYRIAQRIKVNDKMAEDFLSGSNKYVSSTGDYRVADLSCLIEQLAAGVAYWSLGQSFTMDDLSGGLPLRVIAVGAASGPLGASSNTIWLPAHADDISSPHVVSAVVAAAAAGGSTVVTDRLVLDASNCPIIEHPVDGALAEGCLNALRILGSNYAHNNAGGVFAYAMAKGFTKILTVVGQSDEGAFMRRVLREHGFVPSYGGINTLLRSWDCLPQPLVGSKDSWVGFCDGLALSIAASVALADPCIEIDSKVYPTVVGAPRLEVEDAGVAGQQVPDNPSKILNEILKSAPMFSKQYVSVLAQVWGLNVGATTDLQDYVAHNALLASFSLGNLDNDRHLRYNVLAPWYWVEPTGIIDIDVDTVAQKSGFGVLCTRSREGVIPLFEDLQVLETRGVASVVQTSWTCARKSGYVLHYSGHRLDGLKHLVPVQFDPEQIVLPGPGIAGRATTIRNRQRNRLHLASYLWRRGENRFCAPSELVYTGGGMRMVITHQSPSAGPNTWGLDNNHAPSSKELALDITLVTAPLELCDTKPIGHINTEVQASFCEGVAALRGASYQPNTYSSFGQLGRVIARDCGSGAPLVNHGVPRPGESFQTQKRSEPAAVKVPVSIPSVKTGKGAEVQAVRVHEPARAPTLVNGSSSNARIYNGPIHAAPGAVANNAIAGDRPAAAAVNAGSDDGLAGRGGANDALAAGEQQ